MPNWCEQDLRITCTRTHKDELLRFKKNFEKEIITSDIIPYPDSRLECIKEYNEKKDDKDIQRFSDGHEYWYNKEGYGWCSSAWGSKWGICHWQFLDQIDKPQTLLFEFESAWSPCSPVIEKLSKMFPNLTFYLDYYESGCGFSGSEKYQDGELIDETYNNEYTGWRGG